MSTQALTGRRALTTSITSTSYAAVTSTSTRPSGDGVFDIVANTLRAPDLIKVIPIGTATNNQTGGIRVVGWQLFGDVWQSMTLGDWDVTFSSSCPGVSGSATQADTELAADTIVPTAAFTAAEGIAFQTISPANDTCGHILVDRKGCPIIQIQPKKGTGTNCNAIIVDL